MMTRLSAKPGRLNGTVAAEDAPAKAIDNSHHGIEAVKEAPLFRDDLAAESYGRNIKAEPCFFLKYPAFAT